MYPALKKNFQRPWGTTVSVTTLRWKFWMITSSKHLRISQWERGAGCLKLHLCVMYLPTGLAVWHLSSYSVHWYAITNKYCTCLISIHISSQSHISDDGKIHEKRPFMAKFDFCHYLPSVVNSAPWHMTDSSDSPILKTLSFWQSELNFSFDIYRQ